MRKLKKIKSALVLASAVSALSFSLVLIKAERETESPLAVRLVEVVLESGSSSRSPASVSEEVKQNAKTGSEVYTLDRSIQAVLHSKTGDKTFADLDYKGEFYLSWKDDHAVWISFDVRLPKEKSKETAEMKSTVPFMLVIAKDGRIQDIQTVESSKESDQNEIKIMKDFASLYAFRSDADTAGKYEAKFSEEKGEILKKKTKYTDAKFRDLTIERSEHRIVVDDSKKLKAAEGLEITRAKSGKEIEIRTESMYKIIRKGSSSRDSTANAKNLKSSPLLLVAEKKPALPWPELATRLDGVRGLTSAQRLALFHELVNALDSDSPEGAENLKNFKNWLALHANEPGILNFAIGALATAGGPEAQKSLLQIYQEHPEQRHVVLNALSTSNAKLTPDTRTFLTNLMDQHQTAPDFAYNASFALGSGIRQDPVASDIAKLERLVNQATTNEQRENYLDAVGNSGNQSFLPLIAKNLSSDDDGVREKAVLALRLMKTEASESLVFQSWKDSSAKVRAAAVRVIDYQGAPSVYRSILQECAQATSSMQTRCARMLDARS